MFVKTPFKQISGVISALSLLVIQLMCPSMGSHTSPPNAETEGSDTFALLPFSKTGSKNLLLKF